MFFIHFSSTLLRAFELRLLDVFCSGPEGHLVNCIALALISPSTKLDKMSNRVQF